jgi:hypothetical protein
LPNLTTIIETFDIFVCIKSQYDIGSLASDVDDFGIITPHSRHFTAKNNHIWKIQVIALNAAGVVFLKYILVYNSSSSSSDGVDVEATTQIEEQIKITETMFNIYKKNTFST